MKNNINKIVQEYLNIYPGERDNLSKLLELLMNNDIDNLFNRKNFKGHITASGFIYSLKDNKLLFLEHKALNKYLQPGGHVESVDNEILDTAKREILEETGISEIDNVSITDDYNIPFDINSHYIPENKNKNEDGHYHHDFRFLFVVDSTKDVKIDSNESNDYKWISIDEVINDDRFGLSIKKIKNIIDNKFNKSKIIK